MLQAEHALSNDAIVMSHLIQDHPGSFRVIRSHPGLVRKYTVSIKQTIHEISVKFYLLMNINANVDR